MMKVYIVFEKVIFKKNEENTYIIRSFLSETMAIAFCKACNDYRTKYNPNLTPWKLQLKEWKESHPAYGYSNDIVLDGIYDFAGIEQD